MNSTVKLLAICLAQFVVVLDVTVVNVALPSIGDDLALAAGDLGLVVTAYTVVFGGLLLLGGRAADVLGARRTFAAGLALFTTASLGAGLAPSGEALIAARVAQGAGAALLSPAALSLLVAAWPSGPEHRRAFAAWSATGALGVTAGVLLGGVLTDVAGWRSVFLVNLPVAVVLVAGTRTLRAPAGGGRLGLPSALSATVAMAAMLLAVSEELEWGYAVAAAGVAAFVLAERRAARPLVPVAAVARRPALAGLALMFVAAGTMVSTFFVVSLHLQEGLGHSALRTGLEFLPLAVGVTVAAQLGGHLLGHVGPRPLAAGGLALATGGAVVLAGLGPGSSYAEVVLPGTLLVATGLGFAFVTFGVLVMSGAPGGSRGVLGGLLTTAHELGATVLVAVAAASTAPFEATAWLTGAGTLLALIALRRADVPAGARAGFAH